MRTIGNILFPGFPHPGGNASPHGSHRQDEGENQVNQATRGVMRFSPAGTIERMTRPFPRSRQPRLKIIRMWPCDIYHFGSPRDKMRQIQVKCSASCFLFLAHLPTTADDNSMFQDTHHE
jgi:hypothetical protein